MIEYQIYGVDRQGQVTHAGVHKADAMSIIEAGRIQRRWLAWRRKYLQENPGDYPLRQDAKDRTRRTVNLIVEELGKPETRTRYGI